MKAAFKKAIGDTILPPFKLCTVMPEIANLVTLPRISIIAIIYVLMMSFFVEELAQFFKAIYTDSYYLCPNDVFIEELAQFFKAIYTDQESTPPILILSVNCQSIQRKWSNNLHESQNVRIGVYMAIAHLYCDNLIKNVAVRTSKGTSISKIAIIYPAPNVAKRSLSTVCHCSTRNI